jgi:hypothetical protein
MNHTIEDTLNAYLALDHSDICAIYRAKHPTQLVLLEVSSVVSSGDFWSFTTNHSQQSDFFHPIILAVVSEEDFENLRSGQMEMTPIYGKFEDLERVWCDDLKYENHPKPTRNTNWDSIPDDKRAGYNLAVKDFIAFVSGLNPHSASPDVEIGYLLSQLKSGKFRNK